MNQRSVTSPRDKNKEGGDGGRSDPEASEDESNRRVFIMELGVDRGCSMIR